MIIFFDFFLKQEIERKEANLKKMNATSLSTSNTTTNTSTKSSTNDKYNNNEDNNDNIESRRKKK